MIPYATILGAPLRRNLQNTRHLWERVYHQAPSVRQNRVIVGQLGVLLLQEGAVTQNQLGHVAGRIAAVDAPGKAIQHKPPCLTKPTAPA